MMYRKLRGCRSCRCTIATGMRWIDVMRHAVALNGSFFNTERMMSEYARQAYRLALEQ